MLLCEVSQLHARLGDFIINAVLVFFHTVMDDPISPEQVHGANERLYFEIVKCRDAGVRVPACIVLSACTGEGIPRRLVQQGVKFVVFWPSGAEKSIVARVTQLLMEELQSPCVRTSEGLVLWSRTSSWCGKFGGRP